MTKAKAIAFCALSLIIYLLSGCMEYEPLPKRSFSLSREGVFVVAEGNFMYGNAALDYYEPKGKHMVHSLFRLANGRDVGDVAQSLCIRGDKGYLVVNNSGVIYEFDLNTGLLTAGIKGLRSPRYIHFLSDTKAYATDLFAEGVTIVNPQTRQITGFIPTKGHASTEQMVQVGRYVYVSCWSYDRKVLVIDTEQDAVVDEIDCGIQPSGLCLDAKRRIWVLSTGGYLGNKIGHEAPSLHCIDPETRSVIRTITWAQGDDLSRIAMNPDRTILYIAGHQLWRMSIDDTTRPERPFIEIAGRNNAFYALGVSPTGEIYLGDAIDYKQAGIAYRISADGDKIDEFRTSVNPNSFVFR